MTKSKYAMFAPLNPFLDMVLGRRFRYLVYLNNPASGERIVKTIDLFDQKTAP